MYLFISGRKWFVSKNGTDLSDCGKTYKTACASFRALWGQIIDDENNITNNVVKTYRDLIIDHMHLHGPDKVLVFENKASHVINITITRTTIDNTDLTFSTLNSRISFHIENCFIHSSLIGLSSLSQPVVIRNCFIRSSLIHIDESKQPIIIRNCTFHGNTTTDNTTSLEVMSGTKVVKEYSLISCLLSSIIMVNVAVRDSVGPGMWFTSCNVQITGSHFTNNNLTALMYSHHSEFKIEKSHFINNRNINGEIRLNWNSKAHVINSTFTGNKGKKAGGIYLEYHSEANVTNSTFTANKGEWAGGIYLEQSKANVTNSIFTGNEGKWVGGIVLYKSEALVTGGTLTGNKGESVGGIFLQESEANVTKSIFTGNEGELVGGIVLVNSEARVTNSTLTGNKGEKAGGIYLEESKANVSHSTVIGNQGHALVVTTQSKAITTGCQFLYNVVTGQGAAVHVSQRSEYHDQGSLFTENGAGEGGKILNKNDLFKTYT